MQYFATAEGVVRRDGDTWDLTDRPGGALHDAVLAGSLDPLRDARRVRGVAPADVVALAPYRPARIVIVGLNYRSHAAEVGVPVPEALLFAPAELPEGTLIADLGEVVAPPDHPDQLDYEAEIAIVIGRDVGDVTPDDPWSAVVGVTAVNDITARDLQMSLLAEGDYTSAKLLPSFKPIGPGIIDAAEARRGLAVGSSVNGELRQSATDADMVFSIPEIVSTIGSRLGLRAGDLIITGSPAGVGGAAGSFLQPGDVVEVTVGGLPPLRNTVTALR